MIVDFHTHTYPDKIVSKTLELLVSRSKTKPASDGTLAGLQHSMAQSGVDISVVLPVVTAPHQVERINTVAKTVTAQFTGSGVWSFGGIHPGNDNYKEILNGIKSAGLKGIKLHPDYQDAMFNDIRYKRIIGYATELGLVVVVHAGVDIGLPSVTHCTPDMVCEVLDEVQPERFVLAHMGGWNLWDEVLAKLCGRNVYMDTAFSYGEIAWLSGAEHRWKLASEEMFLKLIRAHGADRIVFGTDSPWTDQKRAIKDIQALPLSDEDKKKILGENALQLLGLPDAE